MKNISSGTIQSPTAVITWYDKNDEFGMSELGLVEFRVLEPGQSSPFTAISRTQPNMAKFKIGFRTSRGMTVEYDDQRKQK